MDIRSRGLHGRDTGANHVISPNHQADPCLFKYLGRGCIIFGGYNDQRATVGPLSSKTQYLVRLTVFAVDQNGICPGSVIGLCPLQCLIQTPTCNKSFNPGNDAEIIVSLRILARLDFSTKSLDILQRLRFALYKTVGFGK